MTAVKAPGVHCPDCDRDIEAPDLVEAKEVIKKFNEVVDEAIDYLECVPSTIANIALRDGKVEAYSNTKWFLKRILGE